MEDNVFQTTDSSTTPTGQPVSSEDSQAILAERLKNERFARGLQKRRERWQQDGCREPFNDADPRHWRDYLEAVEADKVKTETRQRRFAAVVGPRYAYCTFENFEVSRPAMQKAVTACREWSEAVEFTPIKYGGYKVVANNLILHGGVGTGKDHLACAVARFLVDKAWRPVGGHDLRGDHFSMDDLDDSPTIRFVAGSQLQTMMRTAMHKGREEDVIYELILADLLVLSDPASPTGGSLTDFQAVTLTQVIDGRYAEQRPIIVTANCRTRDEMNKLLTTPIADRLIHGATVVPCDWPSYRKVGAATRQSR